ncbi:MAG TPA: dihydroxyacetone kinase subunit DhaL [Anaerovoracaceae bacterium]|nr:dihydroxyacetone kinase subunit DhaL [Anaerovoracaceae bacterium]
MDRLSTQVVVNIVGIMSDIIIRNEVHFCDLDSMAGDGDFGMSLAKGFKVVRNEWEQLPRDEIGHFLTECGMLIIEHCGGASGPIWGNAFRSMGKYAQGKVELNLIEVGELLQSAIDGIQKCGGAKLGDKTLLDALIPAAETLKECGASSEEMISSLKKSAEAAAIGAEKTKEIVATKGRASYLGERSINYPDAGAMAIGIIFKGIADRL